MKVVLAELRAQYDVAQYDVVLIDSPPLLPVTDAAAVAPATDGAILVCRFKETTRDQVAAAVEALDAVSARVLGQSSRWCRAPDRVRTRSTTPTTAPTNRSGRLARRRVRRTVPAHPAALRLGPAPSRGYQ